MLNFDFDFKSKKIQKRALRFLLNDYESDYETFLKKVIDVQWE